MSEGSYNFSSVPARAQRAKLIAQAARTNGKINFLHKLEEVCKHTTAAERRGRPGVISPRRRPRPRRSLHGGRLEVSQAPPDDPVRAGRHDEKLSARSWRSGTLATAGAHVGFVDWELDAPDHSLRDQLLHGAARPDIHYLRAEQPLVYELPRIQQWKHDHGAGLSRGWIPSRMAPPASRKTPRSTMAYIRALRALDCGGLAIAHVRKDGQNPTEAEKFPFGSIFWHNSARCTWFVKDAEQRAQRQHDQNDRPVQSQDEPVRETAGGGFAIDFDADRDAVLARGRRATCKTWRRVFRCGNASEKSCATGRKPSPRSPAN